ncbi:ADP-ribosylglycohydrolase family protein [Methanogenium sp. MK-MG]|uniref:ADP-ribosylglycohydrolase family protein n=1 Tax=Methanogenium sp. MK-MG TaxID=2599926 RepID=UPI0013EA19F8|nr:ADP-ribosylglycohydrolase family protein [Methanogenium sp. MK-MG]
MLSRYRGCMLGAAIGDALGMPQETLPPSLSRLGESYGKPLRRHPNEGLRPGQFTDDTQMMLCAAELLGEGAFTPKEYGSRLAAMHARRRLRFPDGTVSTACARITAGLPDSGRASTTAGCMALAVPFALACRDGDDMRERLQAACEVTHTHPAAYGATISYALFLRAVLHRHPDPFRVAEEIAGEYDVRLAGSIRNALALEKEGLSLETALISVGNDVAVYHTYPLSLFLIARFGQDETFLPVATHVGGNTDTIGFICGSWLGAADGTAGFGYELLMQLEDRAHIEETAEELFDLVSGKN